ncbi:MAG TPA: lysophospholipid acyltransferase family protein [Bacillota bacterium]|nr:lysophospholipid acyltransferase family protein [Bacillota bacterium]
MSQKEKSNSEKWQFKIKLNLAFWLVNLLGKTLCFKVFNREMVDQYHGKEGFILTSWHGQQLTGFFFFKNCGYYILSSLSRDGDYSSSIMRRFGWQIVRGSTARGAVRGLIELLRVLRTGAGIAITPEGSRGPNYHIEPGCLYLAQKTGAPLIPVAFVYDRKWVFRSWDKFQVPKPFARGVAYFGEPVFIKAELNDEQLEVEQARLRDAIHLANRRGEEELQQWLKGK